MNTVENVAKLDTQKLGDKTLSAAEQSIVDTLKNLKPEDLQKELSSYFDQAKTTIDKQTFTSSITSLVNTLQQLGDDAIETKDATLKTMHDKFLELKNSVIISNTNISKEVKIKEPLALSEVQIEEDKANIKKARINGEKHVNTLVDTISCPPPYSYMSLNGEKTHIGWMDGIGLETIALALGGGILATGALASFSTDSPENSIVMGVGSALAFTQLSKSISPPSVDFKPKEIEKYEDQTSKEFVDSLQTPDNQMFYSVAFGSTKPTKQPEVDTLAANMKDLNRDVLDSINFVNFKENFNNNKKLLGNPQQFIETFFAKNTLQQPSFLVAMKNNKNISDKSKNSIFKEITELIRKLDDMKIHTQARKVVFVEMGKKTDDELNNSFF